MPRNQPDPTEADTDNAEVNAPISRAKIALGIAGLYWELSEAGIISTFADKQALRTWVDQLGPWGPLAVILMLVAAIVMSPIPSGRRGHGVEGRIQGRARVPLELW
jgi:hypothetical protein